jgi:hypothetical protein
MNDPKAFTDALVDQFGLKIDCLSNLGFVPSKVDPDVWMKGWGSIVHHHVGEQERMIGCSG